MGFVGKSTQAVGFAPKVVQGMVLILVLVLYTNGRLLTGNEPLMIKVRRIWPLKFELKNHGNQQLIEALMFRVNICWYILSQFMIEPLQT